MTKRIPLTRGKFALVSDEDFNTLSQYRWYCSAKNYAVRSVARNTGPLFMHRVIMDAPDGLEVDHINGDKLDNRRDNLRHATSSQNKANVGPFSGKYKGVDRKGRKWRAQIRVNGKKTHLGLYSHAIQAAMAYDSIAFAQWGEFAYLNFPHLLDRGNGDD